MKKTVIFSLLAAFCLSLSACSNGDKSSSSVADSKNDSVGSSASDTSSVAGGTMPDVDSKISDDRKSDDHDALVAKFTPLFRQYYAGITEKNFDKCFGIFPSFYQEAVKAECKENGQTTDQYMETIYQSEAAECGEDFNITFTFDQFFQLTDESLATYQNILKDSFGFTDKIEDAYSVKVTESTRGTSSSTSYELEWFVFQIDGTLYLYENYYEKQS